MKVNLDALTALIGKLAASQSPARALADVGELLVILIDIADRTGRVQPGPYHHLLVAPGSWDERRRRLADAGLLELDGAGRLQRIPERWHRALTAGDAPDGAARRTVPFAVAQRHEFRSLVAQLRACRNRSGRPLPGIGRLLPLLIVLASPTVSDGDGYVVRSQGELAAMLGVTAKTLRRHLGDLAGLGLAAPATRRRHSRSAADSEALWWVGATRDRLAGRTWQQSDQSTASSPARRPPTQSGHLTHPAPSGGEVISLTLLRGSSPRGFQPSSGTTAHPQDDGTTTAPRGGVAPRRWTPGPGTRESYRRWTVDAVDKLPLNAQSIRDIVAAADHKALGVGLRRGVVTALDSALAARARHQAGETLTSDQRDLVDAVARLARSCDDLCAVGLAGRASVTLALEDPAADGPQADRWWQDGEVRPAAAVRLFAARLQPHVRVARAHPAWADTRGNWRRRAEAEATRCPPAADPVTDSGNRRSSKAKPQDPQAPSPQAVRLVTRVALAAMDARRADRDEARRITQAWVAAALAWWDGPPPSTGELTDPDVRHIVAAWVAAHPMQARRPLR